jgi:hypothetical protein
VARDLFAEEPSDEDRLAQALTTRPDEYLPEYHVARNAWLERRARARANNEENDEDPPSSEGMVRHHSDRPNTIDIGTWFLNEVTAGDALAEIDDNLYHDLRGDPSFLDSLKSGREIKDIDALAGELSLTGLILHEVSK